MIELVRFRKLSEVGAADGVMIWFPHAGGTSASVVRQTRGLALSLETWVAVLPGREERWNETVGDLKSLIDEWDHAIGELGEIPLVLSGHSFGGLLAYLLAERRCREGRPPRALMPMAIAPPDRLESQGWSRAADHELVDHLDSTYGAIPESLRGNHEALAQFLPVVRHDLSLLESYQHQPCEPLPIPIIACGGRIDRAVDETLLAGWRRFTSARCEVKMFEGDHFFPYPHFETLNRIAQREVAG